MTETRQRTFVIAIVAVALAAALAAGVLLGRSAGGASAATSPQTTGPGPTGPITAPPTGEPVFESVAQAQPAPQPSPQPQPAPQPVPPVQPAPQPAPEPAPQAGPGILVVAPNHVALAQGQWTAQFTVANVGESALSWFAVGVPSQVGLSAYNGVLAPGTETTVTATVAHTALAQGPFSLKLHISANDTADSVTITGTKQVKVAVPLGPQVLKP
ncbi:MAG: hypothetical protein AB1673_02360 [Actinomycetota bacterium]